MSIYPPTGTLEIKNATLKIPVVDLQYTSNTAKLEANSNVVTEFSRSKKLIKYPRVALTQNALNSGYTVIQSGTNGSEHRKAWTLFNNDVTTDDQYHAVADVASGETNPYNYVSGAYEPDAGFEDGLGDVAGEYVYVVMPDKIKLQGVSVHPRDGALNRSAESARFMGSNNGTTWIDLGGYTNYVWASGSQEPGNFFTVESNEYYNYIGVVWTKVKGGSGGDTVNMAEVQFFGVPEYDPEADGTDVTLKSLTNVPNTDWLEVYYDAKGLGNGSTTVNDLKPVGTANNGTVGGNTSVTDEAFTFDGTGDYITSTVTTGTGNQSFSVACWFKFTTLGGLLWGFTGTTNGTSGSNPTNNSTPHAYFNTTGSINFDFWANSTVTAEKLIEANRWYSGVWTYDGTMRKIYINGTQVHLPQSSTPLSIIDNTSRLSIGIYPNNLSGGPMTGSVANFRLFNRALTTDEIYQLYAYQKEDFGHGDLSMTLKAGRLGIGTSDPGAVLDVRGDIYRNGIPAFPIPTAHFYKQSSSTTSTSHYANIRDGWVALTHAPVTVPGVIEKYSLAGADYTTDSGNSGLVVKLCKEGLYKIEFNCSLSTQSGINSHIGVYIRPVYTSYISENTGTSYIGIGQSNGYNVIQGTGSNNAHLFNHHEIIRVTKAPGYAFVTMTPNSNDSTHFRFENYGSTPYAVMNVMYLG